jgi:hypothetical protein
MKVNVVMKKSPKSFKIFALTVLILFGMSLLALRFHSVGTSPRKKAAVADSGQTEFHKPQIETWRESEPVAAARENDARNSSSFATVSLQPETTLLFPTQLTGINDLLAQNQPPERSSETEGEGEARPDQPDEALKWRMMQLVDEDGSIPHNALINAREQAKKMAFDAAAWPTKEPDESGDSDGTNVAGIQRMGWTWLGPGNIGGRVRSIVVHPTNAQIIWVGSVGGGIWKTTNGGASWIPLDDFMVNIAVTSLVMHPSDPNVIYAGTGEGFGNIDSLRGAGVFKTTNGGTTWTQLASTSNSDWYWVNRLAINPGNGQIILAATNTGIYRSTDGGASWSNRSFTRALDINFNPLNGNECIASGSPDARYSTDGGQTWNIASGLPPFGRVEVAYARSNPAIVYASVDNNSGELYRSTNGGQSYTLVNSGLQYLRGQGWYDNALWVDPTDSDNVIVGGLDLWRSVNGGASLTQISQWFSAPTSAHADHHVIVESSQFGQLGNRTVFFGNDGGIYKTTDYLATTLTTGWIELNNNLGITQFYGGAGNPTSGRILGGTQDNGTLRYTGNTETWNTPYGGDGGWCAADPTDSNYFYGEYVNLQIHRSTNGGISSSSIYSGLTDAEQGRANFIAPFILDPNNPNTLLAGGDQLWRSTNVKATTPTWSPIKASSSYYISAIAVAKGNSNIIWVGHGDGAVYFTTNGTAASPLWTRVDTNSPGLPNRYCTRITIDPTNSNRVYVTFGGFSSGNVWRSDNGGGSWTNITSNLPSAPVRSLAVWQQNPSNLYVGTEIGIFASADGGQSWSPSNDGPTNCSVDELFWMGNTLVAVTHGRGMFSIDITGQPFSIGQDAPNPQLFIDAANRSNFLLYALQPPTSAVYRWNCTTCDPGNPTWGKGLIQDFNDVTPGVHDALMLADTNTNFVAQIYGGMWDKFTQLGGLNYDSANTRMLGYPLADRNCTDYNAACSTDAQLISPFNTSYHYQRFQGATLVLHRSGAKNGQTYETHGAIRAKWQTLGGAGSSYGLPISDEYASLGKRRSDFEGGAICYNPTTGQTEAPCDTQTNYTITVSASPSIGGTVSGGGTFAAGSSRTLTATANSNYVFTNWTENGSIVSTSASYTFTLNGNRTLVANFTTIGSQASYDTILKAPKCGQAGSVCDSGTLLNGRDNITGGPELHQPNTINNTCADGTDGTYHVDESIDKLKVSTLDGSNFAPGKTVKIEATVWVWSGVTPDYLDLYYAADATNPNWTFITTLQPSAAGTQLLSTNYTLPTGGSLQAVRARFRYMGEASSCGSGGFDDHDDLIFAASAPPASVQVTVQTSPVGRSFTVDGTTYSTTRTFTWTPGSSHSIGTTTPQSGGVGTQYVWSKWSDNGAITHNVAPGVNTTYTASFVTVTAPLATTTAATSITTSSATLNGVVNPKGAATNYWFEWGTSPTLATFNQTPAQAIGAGSANVAVNRILSLLNSKTTYYYRVVGANSLGTAKGAILSFLTGGSTLATENVVWANTAGVSVSGNNLTKTAPTLWGNAGASSTRAIASGDGYVQFTATSITTFRMCGLSKDDSDWSYTDIDYALYVGSSGKVYIHEKGVLKGAFGTYVAGDVFRVAVEGGVVKYRKNGILLYTSTVAPTYPLLVDAALHSSGATINNTVISGNLTAGSVPTLENVVWANAAGVSISGNNLTKTASTLWGNAGAISSRAIASGDGYVEFAANSINTYRVCGLSKGDTDRHFSDIDYALYLGTSGKLYVFEKGVQKALVGSYIVGDVFRVGVESGVVKYRKNGILLYTSTIAPAYPLLVDTSLYSLGSVISNAKIQGSLFR